MTKYKIFKATEEEKINKFLDEHVHLENGIRFVEDNIVILYNDLNTDSKTYKIYNLTIGMGAVKETLRNNQFDLNLLILQQKRKRGGKGAQEKLMSDIENKKREIEWAEDLIKIYEESIKNVK